MKISDNIRNLSKGEYEFSKLQQRGKLIAEYIWIGGTGMDIRSKARTLDLSEVLELSQIPDWNYDGSSTLQADGENSEVWLVPRAFYLDPFRQGNNILVLCDTWKPDGTPANTNFRHLANEILRDCAYEKPWFSFEQEYVLFRTDSFPSWPLGFPEGGYPRAQGPYYCGVGGDVCYGRQIMEAHYKCCLYSGLHISGTNAEVMPGQWEYQIGPCLGIEAGDEMWISRYLLLRVSEHFGVAVNWDSKPMEGWNGSGCHTNYSTRSTRNSNGLDTIYNYIRKLEEKHKYFIEVTGYGNHKRLTGNYETSSMEKFSYGIADRSASIRIPRVTEKAGKGYLEDRRPASNCDPYVISGVLADLTILEGLKSSALHDDYISFLKDLNN